MSFVKNLSFHSYLMYFCAMNRWLAGLAILIFTGCKNEPEKLVPDQLKPGEMPAGIKDLFSAVARNPDSTGLRFQLVDALDSLGAYQQALKQVDSLISKDSLNYALWYRKALVQENTHDTTGALRSYRYAIRIYPSPDAMLAAANLLAERKNDTALLITRQVASFRMGREYMAHVHFINGVYYARTGDKKKAVDEFNNCIINDFNYMEAYMEKGFIYFDDKRIPEAIKVFQTVITVKNTYADGYYWLAKCNEALNNKAEAVNNYQRAYTMDPELVEAAAALKRLAD